MAKFVKATAIVQIGEGKNTVHPGAVFECDEKTFNRLVRKGAVRVPNETDMALYALTKPPRKRSTRKPRKPKGDEQPASSGGEPIL